jgi:hypothetical protein
MIDSKSTSPQDPSYSFIPLSSFSAASPSSLRLQQQLPDTLWISTSHLDQRFSSQIPVALFFSLCTRSFLLKCTSHLHPSVPPSIWTYHKGIPDFFDKFHQSFRCILLEHVKYTAQVVQLVISKMCTNWSV